MNTIYKWITLVCAVLGVLVGIMLFASGNVAGGAVVILLCVVVLELEEIATRK